MNPQQQSKVNWHKKNLEQVTNLLYEMGARHISSMGKPATGMLDFYGHNGKVVIVQTYANDGGLEVWRPVTAAMKMADVVEAVRQYLVAPDSEPERTPSLADTIQEVGA